jgi:sodium pump decarboxylase gamma subunit
MKLNGFVNSTMLAMSDNRGLNELLKMLQTDPESISTLTSSEKTLIVLFVAGLGMAVTFAVLIFLWFCISVLSSVLQKAESKKTQPSKVEKVVAPVQAEIVEEDDEDEELIAVIAAAVAASMNTSIHNIVVKNIVRVNDHSPSWAKTGRIEQMNTRF